MRMGIWRGKVALLSGIPPTHPHTPKHEPTRRRQPLTLASLLTAPADRGGEVRSSHSFDSGEGVRVAWDSQTQTLLNAPNKNLE
ncbi:hypothetical protein QC762_0109430 [Podospora pseudocomata]|uniref:Uncharacterized protein n=1 Tax=Podospora pseudocomata TaxID=2093779 RepID=A0ABR0G3S4_9PEZI|nr:hypothetical protein QC762_0109430 [Podospora pseudocomata]